MPIIVDPMSPERQRAALEVLTKSRLVELASGFELGVPRQRPKAAFIDALAEADHVPFERVLTALSRDELRKLGARLDW